VIGPPKPPVSCKGGLIEGLDAEAVMADAAYDSDQLRQTIADKGAIPVIPNNPSRAKKHPLDKHLYAQRHLVGQHPVRAAGEPIPRMWAWS
jgi:transposase